MKRLLLAFTAVLFFALALSSCKKDETNNVNNNGNTENPGGGSGSDSQDYPSTAIVIHDAVTDIDGNSYDAVQIGNQVWMAENLRTTRYADGTVIGEGTFASIFTPSTDVDTYGYLYNWDAVMQNEDFSSSNPSGIQGICPTGWHVPSNAEWTQLTAYLGSHSEYVCSGSGDKIAKALASTNGWLLCDGDECVVGNNPSTNNVTGFSALPAGSYNGNGYVTFGNEATFWSTSGNDQGALGHRYATRCLLSSNAANVDYRSVQLNTNYGNTNYGFSVRCVRD